MTRGRCGLLHLHRGGLSPPTSCRRNRRTLQTTQSRFCTSADRWLRRARLYNGLGILPLGQQLWLMQLESYQKYPPLQSPETYNLTQVMREVNKMHGGNPSEWPNRGSVGVKLRCCSPGSNSAAFFLLFRRRQSAPAMRRRRSTFPDS